MKTSFYKTAQRLGTGSAWVPINSVIPVILLFLIHAANLLMICFNRLVTKPLVCLSLILLLSIS